MNLDQHADQITNTLRTMRKWGFSVIEDAPSARQPDSDRLRRAEIVAVELLGPESTGSAAAARVARVLVQTAEAVRDLSQFEANTKCTPGPMRDDLASSPRAFSFSPSNAKVDDLI